MKIFHVCPAYHPAIGGAETHMKQISELLAARNHKVTILTSDVRTTHDLVSKVPGGLPKSETINNVKIIRFNVQGEFIGRVLSRWYNVRGGHRSIATLCGKDSIELLRGPMTLQIIPYILRHKADVVAVMNWYFPMAYQLCLAKKMKNFNLIGFPLFHTAESWAEKPLFKKMARMYDALIVNTSHEAVFAKELNVKDVSVGGVGIWPSEFNSRNGLIIRNRYGIKSNPIVGFVGRADKLKGIILLIEAMRVVWNWNENVRLILAGPKPDRNGEVARCLNELKFEDRARIVEIHDFSENDKASIYDAFDVFVLPSIAESFGIAYLEAWMCQKPVIGGRIGSTQSVIQENVDGLLVDPGNSKELADKIIHLLRDQNLQNTMGKAGYAKTMKYHTWEKVTDRVEHIYRSVVDLQGRVAQAKTSLRF